jgi:nucleoside-diphosphate-sugar epimerase
MKHKRTVLVTGASGFIGSNLVTLLTEMNYKVIGINKKCNENSSYEIITFEKFIQDLYDPSVFEDVVCVFNIANTYDSSNRIVYPKIF